MSLLQLRDVREPQHAVVYNSAGSHQDTRDVGELLQHLGDFPGHTVHIQYRELRLIERRPQQGEHVTEEKPISLRVQINPDTENTLIVLVDLIDAGASAHPIELVFLTVHLAVSLQLIQQGVAGGNT